MLPNNLKKNSFSVPTDYFDNLPERIILRCEQQAAKRPPVQASRWVRVHSQLAFAAGFALLVGFAYFAARQLPRLMQSNDEAQNLAYAITAVDAMYYAESAATEPDEQEDSDALNDDAVEEYLFDTTSDFDYN